MSIAACIKPIGPPVSTRRSVFNPDISTLTPLLHLAEHVLLRNLAILEHQLARVRTAHAELVELLRRAESLHALFDEEGRHARAAAILAGGAHVDDQHVGLGAVGDPHLVAVGDPHIAAQFRACTASNRRRRNRRPARSSRARPSIRRCTASANTSSRCASCRWRRGCSRTGWSARRRTDPTEPDAREISSIATRCAR